MHLPNSKKSRWLTPLFAALLLVAAAAAVWFFGFRKEVEPFAAVPSDTALLIDFQGFTRVCDSLESSAATVGLGQLSVVRQLMADVRLARQVFDSLPFFKKSMADGRLLAALNFNAADSLHAVFILDLGAGESADLANWLPFSAAKRWFPYSFRGGQVFTIYAKNGQRMAAASKGNVLIFARQTVLVEDALGQILTAGRGIFDDDDFRQLMKKTSAPLGLRLFFQPAELAEQLAPRLVGHKKSIANQLRKNIRWAAMSLQPGESLALNGSLKLAEKSPLHLFEKMTTVPGRDDLASILPDNTACWFWAGFSETETVFGKKEPLPTSDFQKFIRPWIGPAAALVITEPFSNDLLDEQFLALPVVDSLACVRRLTMLGKERGVLKRWKYNTFEITQFLSGAALEMLLPDGGDAFQNPCAAMLGNYLVFAHSPGAMELFIDKFIVSQTLANSADYLLLSQLFDKNGQFFGFFHAAFAPAFAKSLLAEPFRQLAGRDLKTISKLGAVGFSIEKTGGETGWFDFKLTTQPATELANKTTILWKTTLAAAAIDAPPSVVKLPDGGHRILVQDVDNQLHFLTEGGEILWKRRLENRLLGPVQCLDWEGNGQPFFMFNTPQRIHLLDENGEEALGFPLDLQSSATAGVAAFDFDGTRRWQFFIPCLNGNTYGFEQSGRPLPGWNPCQTGICRFAVQHFQTDYKDFLLTLSQAGELGVYARNGDARQQLFLADGRFPQPPAWDTCRLGPRIVVSNQRGKTWVLTLKNDWFSINLKKTGSSRLAFADLGGDRRKDFIQLADTLLTATGWADGKFVPLFSTPVFPKMDTLFTVPFGKRETRIGTFSRATRQVFLFDRNGNRHPDFPLAGSTPFVVADLFQNRRANVLVVANGRSLMAVQLRGG